MSDFSLKDWLSHSAAGAWRQMGAKPTPNEFGILMYHRVTEAPRWTSPPTWNVEPQRLYRQLSGLLADGYTPWSLTQALDAHENGADIPPRTFVVTFDDGYANNLTEALPVLQELHVPATVFVATAYLDSPQPFPSDDWDSAGSPCVSADAWRLLTSPEVERLLDSGLVEIGSHTHTHADFRDRPDDLAADLQQSLDVLRRRFGITRPTFAFPYGTKSTGFAAPELVDVVRRAGLRCSLTTESVTVPIVHTPFDWGRFTATPWDTPLTLAAKLDGCFTQLKTQWRKWAGFRSSWSVPAAASPLVRTQHD